MDTIASKNVRKHSAIAVAAASIGLLYAAVVGATVHGQAAGTTVQSIICASSSTITMNQPQSDSTVADSVVNINGSIVQTSQIEVSVDGQFDSIVPVSIGQSTFQTTVQLSPGTHTISLTAVDTCQINNASVISIVTYTPSPQTPSNGISVPTTVGELGMANGVSVYTPNETTGDVAMAESTFLPQFVIEGYHAITRWLNISTTDTVKNAPASLSVGRAFAIAIGSYILAFGIATQVIQFVYHIPLVKRFFGGRTLGHFKWMIRGIGLVILLLGMFL